VKTAEEGKEKRENLVLKTTFENSKRKKRQRTIEKTLCGGVYICGAPNWARARSFFSLLGAPGTAKLCFGVMGLLKKTGVIS
jgi:hypothetical protein